MRKIVILGVVLICAVLIVSRIPSVEAAATRTPTLVEVSNFPVVQSVAGTVNVGNLPLDADGNLKVAGNLTACAGPVHFVGITQANLDVNIRVFEASRACNAEFPGSRICEYKELTDSIPPPPTFPGPDAASVAFPVVEGLLGVTVLEVRCVRGTGAAVISGCASLNIYSSPVACCGH